MSVAISRSDIGAGATRLVPRFVRADGYIRADFGVTPRGTRATRIVESGGYCIRFPRPGVDCEAVLINTGGGMAGGDRMTVAVTVGEAARATVTTQAAEKIYRAQQSETQVSVAIELGPDGYLAWLPQETILFSGSRLRRNVDITMAGSATLILVESVVFGRTAMGEVVDTGLFRDRWRVHRGGRLVLAEDVHLEGALGAVLSRKAIGAGARAVATVLTVAPDAEERIEAARTAIEQSQSQCGTSAWNGMLIARFLALDARTLRADLVRFVERLRARNMPRSWQT